MMKSFLLFCLLAINYGDAQIVPAAVFVRYQALIPPPSASFSATNVTTTVQVYMDTTAANAFIAAEIAAGININSDPSSSCSNLGAPECGSDSTCSNVGNHGYQCACNSGYTDMSTTTYPPTSIIAAGTTCTDTNECLNTTVCGVVGAGACTNSPGSFSCACNPGFNATMGICVDFDECAAMADNCHANAVCTNTPGSFTCACNAGYAGNGVTCTDVDECASGSICGASIGTCVNSIGSYTCNCTAGFVSDNVTCVDVLECTIPTHNCDANAACTETPGSFTCACNVGYSGNGTTGNCADVDECVLSAPCSANANCTNNVGSFSCACNSGFRGDGLTCTTLPQENYCYTAQFVTAEVFTGTVASRFTVVEPNVDSVITAIRADVVSDIFFPPTSPPTVTLVGLQATAGNGTQFIVEICFVNVSRTADELTAIFQNFNFSSLQIDSNAITFVGDIDECVEFSNCSHIADPLAATCANTNGSFNCMCTDPFHDVSANMESGVTCISPINITCNSGNTLFVSISIPYLTNLNINETDVFVGTCTAGVVSGDALTFSGLCGPLTTANSSHIISEWNVTNDDPNAVIILGRYINFPVSCSFPRNANASINVTGNINQNFVDGNGVVNGGTSGSPGFLLDIFSGSDFVNSLGANPVLTGERITFRVSETNQTESLSQIRIVTARGRPIGNSNIVIDLITNGCPATGSNINQINPTAGAVSAGDGFLSLDAFFFRGFPGTTIDLEVEVCLRSSTADLSCQTSCASGKRRRSIISYRMKRSEPVEVSFTFARDPNDACSRDCGNGACVLDFDRTEQCICAENSVKAADGSCSAVTIVDNSTETPVVEESQSVTLYVLIALGALLLVMVALAVVIVVFKRNSKAQKEYQLDYVNTNAIKS